MTDQLTDTETTTLTLGWAVTATTPNGMQDTIPCTDLTNAIIKANFINRTRPGTAEVVYRDEEYGPWTHTTDGNQFGTEYEWPDGRTEVEPRTSREDADSSARTRNYGSDGSRARTVSRRARFGEWQPFTAATTAGKARPLRSPRRPLRWWLQGWWLTLGFLLVVLAIVVDTRPLVGVAIMVAGWLCGCWHFLSKLEQYHRN